MLDFNVSASSISVYDTARLHLYTTVYKYTRGKSRRTILEYAVLSPIPVQDVGKLRSITTRLVAPSVQVPNNIDLQYTWNVFQDKQNQVVM